MKRLKITLCILLSLSMFILPSGCDEHTSKTKSDFNYATDMQYIYYGGIFNAPITKSDTGYYYVGSDSIIIYVDKENLTATPLCFEPNCLHDNPTECNAYFNIAELLDADYAVGGTTTVIQYYDGKLYMVCGEYDKSHIEYNTYLMRCDADGSNREQITDYFDKPFTQWFIHRGYFYYTDDKSILRVPINSPKSEPEAIFTLEHYKENGTDTFQRSFAYGDYMYFYAHEYEEGKSSDMYQVCLNLKTLESKKMVYEGMSMPVLTVYGNTVIYKYAEHTKNKVTYYKSPLDCSEKNEFFVTQFETSNNLTADSNYMYFDNNVLKYANPDSEDFEQIITVRDFDNNEVDTFKLPQEKGDSFNYFTAQDDEYFLLEKMVENKQRILCIADKSQIGSFNGKTIEYTELCKLDWYENEQNPYVYTME